jgi:tetratricopeptide (TPR) repeat protein
LKGSEQSPALNQIESDFENIRQAWEEAVNNRAYDLVNRALEAMYLFCFLRSRLEDGKSLFEKARQGLAPGSGEAPHPVWLALGIRFYSTTDSQLVKERLQTSLTHARDRGDELEAAYCLNSLGTIAHYVDQDPPQAIAYYEECAAIYRQLGERYYLAQTLSKLGEAHQLIGQTELTIQYINEAYALQRQIGDYIGESETLRAQSMTAGQTGNFDVMEELQEKALAIQLQTNYMVGQATSNMYLGSFKMIRGQFEEARLQVLLGLDQALEIADYSTQSWCYAILSLIQAARGDNAAAEADLERAELIATDPFRQTGGGNPFLQLMINLGWFTVEAAKGNFEKARGHLLQPLHLTIMTASQIFLTMLPALAAFIVYHDGRPQRAAELLGITLSSPVLVTGWLKEYRPFIELQSELQESLGQVEFEACLKRGEMLDLMTTSEEVLNYLESTGGRS